MTSKIAFKLAYLIPEFPSQTHIFFWREILALKNLGVEADVFSTKRVDLSKVKHDFAEQAEKKCFYAFPPSLRSIAYLASHPLWFVKSLMYASSIDNGIKDKLKTITLIPSTAELLAETKKRNITHVHGHSCANTAHMLSMAALSNAITYSLTLHGGLEVYGGAYRDKMRSAKFVSTVTRKLKKQVIDEVGLDEAKIPVIRQGVDLEKFLPREYKTKEKLSFISVARLNKGKGHEFSLEALKRVKDKGYEFTYHIVGGGSFEGELKSFINELGLENDVIFHGSLSEDDVKSVFEESDILLLTSFGTFEAAPVAVMEAMASGVPCICSIIGGTPDMITSNEDGFLVEQRNVDQIHSAMMEFYENPELVSTMGNNARKTAEASFSHIEQAKLLLHQFTKE